MRALAPSRRPRQAALASGDSPLIAASTGNRGLGGGTGQRTYQQRYQEWQGWAKRFARTVDAANFAAGVVADTCARSELQVEERVQGTADQWERSPDEQLQDALSEYRSALLAPGELVRLHAWHYQVAGECVQTVTEKSTGPGVDFGIYSMAVIEWGKPTPDQMTVLLAPGGKVDKGTAFTAPRANATRFWIPDEEWQAYATSPMVAGIEALRRYWALTRNVRRTANSRLANNGVFWTPGEAHTEANTVAGVPGGPAAMPTDAVSKLDTEYVAIARRAFADEDDEDVASIAAFPMHWKKDWGPPEWVEVGRGLDEQGIPHRKEALEDFARGSNMPASAVVGGGPGDANHWTEWLVDKKFHTSAVAPVMDRITHQDMTATFLVPVLRGLGRPVTSDLRVGYDPSKTIVQQDKSELALRYFEAGLLGPEAALTRGGFNVGEMMTADERAQLLDWMAARKGGPAQVVTQPGAGLPVGPQNVRELPPAQPPALTAAVGDGVNPDAPAPEPVPRASTAARTNRLLKRLATIQQRVGRTLLDQAELAVAEAMRKAGAKVVVRARRANQQARFAAIQAVDNGLPLRSHLAAIGLTETEMLDHTFDTYEEAARAAMAKAAEQQRRALIAAGIDRVDDYVPSPERVQLAANTLTRSLMAMTRGRLVDGVLEPAPGEVTGLVPARMVIDALAVLDGRLGVTLPAGPDEAPHLYAEDSGGIERGVIGELEGDDAEITWLWEWGFYGDPTTPFEPHMDLGFAGFTTSDRESDPALAVDDRGAWLGVDFYQPQDHDGCTCTWVPVVDTPESGPGDRPVIFPT